MKVMKRKSRLGILRKLDYERGEAVVFTLGDAGTGDDINIKRIKPGRVKLIRVYGGFKEFNSFRPQTFYTP